MIDWLLLLLQTNSKIVLIFVVAVFVVNVYVMLRIDFPYMGLNVIFFFFII